MINTVFDSLLEPVFVLNPEGEIVYCNETAATICGSNPRKLVRSRSQLNQIIQFETPLEFLSHLTDISTATPYRELKFKTAFCENGKAQITIQPYSADTHTVQYIVFFRDVTLEERLQKKYRTELEQKEAYIEELKSARNQLEFYSKDLESIVKKRTLEIQDLNILMKTLLDSLNQAFFVFDQNGLCAPFYSKACLTLLDRAPGGQQIWDVLKIEKLKVEGFKNWLFTVFSELLPFEDLTPLGPDHIPHFSKSISLEYFPIRNSDDKIEKIVCVGSDVTDLIQAQKQADKDREKVQSILKMIQNKRELKMFLLETNAQVLVLNNEFDNLLHNQNYSRDGILRVLHTIKGGAATFSYHNLKEAAHALEEKMITTSEAGFLSSDIKLLRAKIETETSAITSFYVDIFGELSSRKSDANQNIAFSPQDIDYLLKLQSFDELRSFIAEIAFTQPVKNLVNQFPLVIEKTAQLLGKSVAPLRLINENVRVPYKLFNPFFNSFVHVLRNSVDHGIETPDIRKSNSKNIPGQLIMEFSILHRDKKFLQITYKDDGQGIDPARIRAKLTERKIDHVQMSDEQIKYFIFNPAFTTRDDVTETSGRGIGLDAVKYEIDQLGGSIKINSKIGEFTEFIFLLPYPLLPHSKTSTEIRKVA